MSALKKVILMIGSGKLALALIFLVIVFSVIGVIIPQANTADPAELIAWQDQHPLATKIAQPLGLFSVFVSWPFIIVLIALAVNTLTCTILTLSKDTDLNTTEKKASQRLAFLILHISIIAIMAAGAWSTAARIDGQAVLTEGQDFKGTPREFLIFNSAPLAKDYVQNFNVKVDNIQTAFYDHRLIDVTSSLVFSGSDAKVLKKDIKVNHPFKYNGISFTQDKTGYSILMDVTDTITKRKFTAMVVLKTFIYDNARVYKNFLKRAFMKNEIMITLYPGHSVEEGEIVKNSELPKNPILFVEQIHQNNGTNVSGYLPLKEKLVLGEYEFEFLDLRKWASFRISKDPGYMPMCIALWLGFAALVLRYARLCSGLFKKETLTTQSDSIE